MAHGVSEVLGEGSTVVKMLANKQQHSHLQQPQQQQQQQQPPQVVQQQQQQSLRKSVGVMGSRRIFAPAFKLKVLDSYRNDIDCRGNQRATARKYGIHRRQIQKWLQCEENLRSCCAEGTASGGNAGVSLVGTPASSPQKELAESLQHQQHQQHHHQQQQQHHQASSGAAATPASPALNLSLARLHGDELAVQQQQPPPPPPPPPPSAVAAQALAAQQQQQQHQHHQANYRFHGTTAAAVAAAAAAAAAVVAPAATTGYPDLKDKVPIQQQQHYATTADYSMLELYQPLAATYHQQQHSSPPGHRHHHHHPSHQQQRYEPADLHHRHHRANSNFTQTFEAKVESSTSSSPLHSEEDSHHSHHQPQRHQERRCVPSSSSALLLAPTEIKTERASPDSAATPGPCESAGTTTTTATTTTANALVATSSGCASTLAATAAQAPHPHVHSPASEQQRRQRCPLKKERLDEEDHFQEREATLPSSEYQLTSLASSTSRSSLSSDSGSPLPSHPDHAESLESLPPSPRDSERSTASSSSSDSEMDYSLPGQLAGGHGAADLARRRSFSLRFKLDVLDAFHRDAGVAGNQRATARKFGINRRQVQKWLGQESELRGVIELCGSGNNRQRLGPVQEEVPVDLRTSCPATTTELGLVSPHSAAGSTASYTCCDIYAASSSPSGTYADSSLTPPYSAPGCSLSCCGGQDTPTANILGARAYYCYSPGELDSSTGGNSLKRTISYAQSYCASYVGAPPVKKPCLEDDKRIEEEDEEEPMQEVPLCLVKPRRPSIDSAGQQVESVSSTVPTPPAVAPPTPTPAPAAKKDAILFKPYLDNPVSKPSSGAADDASGLNNNCQDICNLNERNGGGHDLALELSFKMPVSWRAQQQQQQQQHQPQQQQQHHHHHTQYLDFPHVRSAFVRYPASAHYS